MKAAKSDVKIGDVVVLKICASTSAVAASEIARKTSKVRYTVLHIFRQVLFGAGNQGNHQNFEKSLLTNKL